MRSREEKRSAMSTICLSVDAEGDDERGGFVFVDLPLRVDKSMGAGMGEVSSTSATSLILLPIAEMGDNDEEGEAVFVDFPLRVDKSMGAGMGEISSTSATSLTFSPIAEMGDDDEEREAALVDFPLRVDKSMGAGVRKKFRNYEI